MTETIINPSIEMDLDNSPIVELTAEDKELFFKSILADKPYEETVSLFDGQLKARLRAMTVAENADVVAQIVADRKAGVAAENDAYFITIATYRLGLCLVSIEDKPYSSVTKDNFSAILENDTYILARSRPMRSWATPKLALFLDAFKAFEAKVIKLTNEVQTPNFWKASA
jgi:hypothetical protein